MLEPADVEVVADESPNYRRTRLWLESTMRQTPVPLYQEELSIAEQMLAESSRMKLVWRRPWPPAPPGNGTLSWG